MALELKVPVGVVLSMSIEEFDGWGYYFQHKAKEEKKAAKAAKRGRGR